MKINIFISGHPTRRRLFGEKTWNTRMKACSLVSRERSWRVKPDWSRSQHTLLGRFQTHCTSYASCRSTSHSRRSRVGQGRHEEPPRVVVAGFLFRGLPRKVFNSGHEDSLLLLISRVCICFCGRVVGQPKSFSSLYLCSVVSVFGNGRLIPEGSPYTSM